MNIDKRIIKLIGIFTTLTIGLLSLLGSNHQGTFTPDPELNVKIVDVSNGTPSINESVIVTWDIENPDLLKTQGIRLVSLLIDGNLSTFYQGCLSSYPEAVQANCLPEDQRAASLNFRGPVTLIIDAEDENGRISSSAVKLQLAGMSFKTNQLEFTNPGYPRFTGQLAELSEYEFDKAFGIYANVNQSSEENGRIDDLQQYPVFEQDQAFFGLSWQPEETLQFGFRKGSAFPMLDVSFLETLALENRIWNSNHADLIIHAGTIALNGQVEWLKTNGGDAKVYTMNEASNIEPLFIQIDVRSTDQNPTTLHISDIHVGNPAQGLVVSSYHGHLNPTSATNLTGEYDITFQEVGNALLSNGDIKGATTGFNVTTNNNQILSTVRTGVSVLWSNIPLYPDNDLSALLSTQYPDAIQSSSANSSDGPT